MTKLFRYYLLSKDQFQVWKEPICRFSSIYKTILETENVCYSTQSSMKISDSRAKLQELLDLIKNQEIIINIVSNEDLQNLKLFSKWRCDGSSSHSEYKQTFERA